MIEKEAVEPFVNYEAVAVVVVIVNEQVVDVVTVVVVEDVERQLVSCLLKVMQVAKMCKNDEMI